MKKFICTSILTVLIASMTAVSAQNNPEEYLGLPGDNLNLYATMKLFQESETLEAFERDLNDEKSKINNLDLNGDNLVDYITVTDYADGNAHTIVLRTALNRKEAQDIAVFTVQKFNDGSVQIQLVGDEALYGKNYIVEPIYAETPNPGYKGRTVYTDNVNVVTTTYYEVAAWPVIRFMYNPYYVSWHSSWYWGYYPVYWNPWRPYYWHYYYGYHYNWHNHYYSHYRHCDYNRYHYYDDHYYHSKRQYSSEVAHRVSEGHYTSTYSHPEQRKDGEAMYNRTQSSRSADARSNGSAPAGDRRNSSAVSSRSAGSTANEQNTSETRRSASSQSAPSEQRSSAASTQRSSSSRPATVQKSQPSAPRQQSSVRSRLCSASRQQASVQSRSLQLQDNSLQCRSRSLQLQTAGISAEVEPSASRQQASVQKSQPSASRQQASVQKSQP
jgi:glycosyltransferase involved in cell wall biosynthesis